MTTLASISASQLQKETTANENFISVSPAGLYGRRYAGISGLTWAYYGGILYVNGTATPISDGTVLLTNAATNYIEATRLGVVSANTTGFTAGQIPLYTVVTAGSVITSYTDYRAANGERFVRGRVGVDCAGGAGTTTLTAVQSQADILECTGALTGNRNLVVPTVIGTWLVHNNTSGAFTLTVKTSGGTGIAVPQGYHALVYADGTNVQEAVTGWAGAVSFGGTVTLSGTAANIATGANYISYGGTDAGLSFSSGNDATLSGTLTVSGAGTSLFSGITSFDPGTTVRPMRVSESSTSAGYCGPNWNATDTDAARTGFLSGGTGDESLYYYVPTGAVHDFRVNNVAIVRFSATGLSLPISSSPTGTGTGVVGQIAWDAAYLYVCTATNDWRRIALVDF